MLLPHKSIYIKIYKFNQIYGKGIGLQVRKLSYGPPSVQIITNQVDMAIQHTTVISFAYAVISHVKQNSSNRRSVINDKQRNHMVFNNK